MPGTGMLFPREKRRISRCAIRRAHRRIRRDRALPSGCCRSYAASGGQNDLFSVRLQVDVPF